MIIIKQHNNNNNDNGSNHNNNTDNNDNTHDSTPGLHNKIPAYNIFARGWVAQICFFSLVAAKIFQGLGPKRPESSNGDRVYEPIVHPVSFRRFPSFRTQTLENLTPLPMNKWVPAQPSPWRKS